MGQKLKFALRLLVSVLLLGILIYIAGPAQIYNELVSSRLDYNFAGFILILLGTLIAVYRWYIIMNTLDFPKAPFSFYFKSYFKGIFFNQLLPSSIGGDAVKVIDAAKYLGCKKREAFVGVLIDRGLGIASIFLLNLIFNNIAEGYLPESSYYILNIISLFGIAGFILFMFLYKIKYLHKYSWYKVISVPSESLYKVMHGIKKTLLQSILSLFIHILTFAGVYMIARAFGVDLPVYAFMVIMPPVILLTIIPISLAGWGVREVSMVSLLSYSGVAQETALSISIIFGFTYVIQGLLGLYFFINSKKGV